jgi:pyrimidine operon attenuation protein/uracil phosphoribosyltransferase
MTSVRVLKPLSGGFFWTKGDKMSNKILMDAKLIGRSITRLSHEILERNENPDHIVLIGIHNRGVPLAGRIQTKIQEISGVELSQGSLDITFHRDDFRERLVIPQIEGTDIPFSLDGKIVILVDDVLYTGRTIRAAMDELNSFGRAAKVQLAVLVDRGHRELPIKADFVGKNIPTHEGEHVNVTLTETDDVDSVYLLRSQES